MGSAQSKSNSRRIIFRSGKPASIKSKAALVFVKECEAQLPVIWPKFKGDVMLEADIYYPSRRSDLDESLVMDCLQGRIINNDRQIKSKIIRWGLDPDNPRVEIRVRLCPPNAYASGGLIPPPTGRRR